MKKYKTYFKKDLIYTAFLFVVPVASYPMTVHASEADMADIVFMPFIIGFGLLMNFTFKHLLTRLSGKIILYRIMTYEIIILLIVTLISRMMFNAGWIMISCVYYPLALLTNLTELNYQESQNNIIIQDHIRLKFSLLSASTLLISVAIMRFLHLSFEH